MKKKGFSAEQIIGKLREAEVLLSQGSPVGEVSLKLGIISSGLRLCAMRFAIFSSSGIEQSLGKLADPDGFGISVPEMKVKVH